MKFEELKQLNELSQMQLDHVTGEMARLLRQEHDIREEIDALDTRVAEQTTNSIDRVIHMRSVGVLQLWNDWTRRQRAKLLRDLALVLAEKTDCTERARGALGRRDAISTLQDDARRGRARKLQAHQQEKLLLSSLPRETDF